MITQHVNVPSAAPIDTRDSYLHLAIPAGRTSPTDDRGDIPPAARPSRRRPTWSAASSMRSVPSSQTIGTPPTSAAYCLPTPARRWGRLSHHHGRCTRGTCWPGRRISHPSVLLAVDTI